MQTEARKADKNIKVLLNEVENSIKSIYQSIEKIEYVDSKMSQNFKDRLLRLSMKKNEMQPEEMLVEIMSIQRGIIEYLDIDYNKQATMYLQDEKKTLREKDNEENKYPTAVLNKKKSFGKKRRKTSEEMTSDEKNTPTINRIACIRNENVDKINPFVIVDEDGFKEDFRYLAYEKLGSIIKSEIGLNIGEKIELSDENVYLDTPNLIDIRLIKNGKISLVPISTGLFGVYASEFGSEFGKTLEFAKFLGGKTEIKFRLELLKILRGFNYLDSDTTYIMDRKRFKKEMQANKLYIYYRDMCKKAIEEYKSTCKDFYYQRDIARMRYKKDIRNQVKLENSEEHVDSQESNRVYQQEKTKDGKAFMDDLSEVPR